jgi:hypothetical protein
VLAPNAALREAVTASAGPAGATLQLLEQARASMGLPSASPAETNPPSPLSNLRRAAARCWALLLVRIYECLPLRCPKCGEPMRIIAFVLDRPPIERILEHIGEPTQPPVVLPARSPPQLALGFDQTIATAEWPEMDQTAGRRRTAGSDPFTGDRARAVASAGRRIGACVRDGVRHGENRPPVAGWDPSIDFRGAGRAYSRGVRGLSRA